MDCIGILTKSQIPPIPGGHAQHSTERAAPPGPPRPPRTPQPRAASARVAAGRLHWLTRQRTVRTPRAHGEPPPPVHTRSRPTASQALRKGAAAPAWRWCLDVPVGRCRCWGVAPRGARVREGVAAATNRCVRMGARGCHQTAAPVDRWLWWRRGARTRGKVTKQHPTGSRARAAPPMRHRR